VFTVTNTGGDINRLSFVATGSPQEWTIDTNAGAPACATINADNVLTNGNSCQVTVPFSPPFYANRSVEITLQYRKGSCVHRCGVAAR
jgi:hypothetical protein